MEIATLVNMMTVEEQKECLKIIAKGNLKLFGDVLVEAQREESQKIAKLVEKSAANDEKSAQNTENPGKFDGFLGYSNV